MDNLFKQTSQMIIEKREFLAHLAVDRQVALQPELWKPYIQDGYLKSLRGSVYKTEKSLCQGICIKHNYWILYEPTVCNY